jgi:hypothetical protein
MKQYRIQNMAHPKIEQWPSPGIEALDREIGVRLRRLSDGNATAEDISEASRLIRERADHMMPGILRRQRMRQAEKETAQR